MWYRGYMHYHTSFQYPGKSGIKPEKLAADVRQSGAEFVFCAGDHGDANGDYYWGFDVREFPDYREACLSVKKTSGAMLIPAPEIHLMFPPFTERHEHHACVPIVDYMPSLEPPENRVLAASYTRKVEDFISDAHRNDAAVILTHPVLSVNPQFQAPPPLSVPSLSYVDYLELFTIRGADFFAPDFDCYLSFLSRPDSLSMACCTGVDSLAVCTSLAEENAAVPSNLLYVEGEITVGSLLKAYIERRNCAVYGNYRLEELSPIPSRNRIVTAGAPVINMSVKNVSGKKIDRVEIYRNGILVDRIETGGRDGCDLEWTECSSVTGLNCYVVHVTGGEEHLVTSPLAYDL